MDLLMRGLLLGYLCGVTVSVFTDQYLIDLPYCTHEKCKGLVTGGFRQWKATQRDRHRKCLSPGSKKKKTSSRDGNKHFFLPCGSAVQTSLGCGVTALFILMTARYKWPLNLTNLCINFPSLCFSKCGHSLVVFARQDIKLLAFVHLSAVS